MRQNRSFWKGHDIHGISMFVYEASEVAIDDFVLVSGTRTRNGSPKKKKNKKVSLKESDVNHLVPDSDPGDLVSVKNQPLSSPLVSDSSALEPAPKSKKRDTQEGQPKDKLGHLYSSEQVTLDI